jgi:hypothetical protein
MIVNAAVFTCSICAEPSSEICAYCTKDTCANHRCVRCKRCSDCCECDVPLSAEEVVVEEVVVEEAAAPEPVVEAAIEPVVEAAPEPDTEPSAEPSVLTELIDPELMGEPLDTASLPELFAPEDEPSVNPWRGRLDEAEEPKE